MYIYIRTYIHTYIYTYTYTYMSLGPFDLTDKRCACACACADADADADADGPGLGMRFAAVGVWVCHEVCVAQKLSACVVSRATIYLCFHTHTHTHVYACT